MSGDVDEVGDVDLQPVMRATRKSEPARLPQKVMNQWRSIFWRLSRRCMTATAVYCGPGQLGCRCVLNLSGGLCLP